MNERRPMLSACVPLLQAVPTQSGLHPSGSISAHGPIGPQAPEAYEPDSIMNVSERMTTNPVDLGHFDVLTF